MNEARALVGQDPVIQEKGVPFWTERLFVNRALGSASIYSFSGWRSIGLRPTRSGAGFICATISTATLFLPPPV